MIDTLTTSQAAERLNVPLSTLKAWLEKLDMPLPVDSRGRRLLDERAIVVLETVRSLRERDLGYDTIRRRLADDGVPVGGAPAAEAHEAGVLGQQVRAVILEAIGEQNFMAQAYAEAAREIGRLEERVAALQHQLTAKDAEIRRLARELATARGDEHMSVMAEPGGKPAWKFW